MKRHVILVCFLLLFVFFRLQFIDSVPIWDASSVTHCLLSAITPPFSLKNLNCHHPSQGYLVLLSLGQLFDFGNQYLLSLSNLFLAILALCSFYAILNFFFKNHINNPTMQAVEVGTTMLLLGFNPLFFGLSLYPTLDFAVVVFFLASFYSLIHEHKIQSILFMSLLVFSKEPGLLLYLTLIFSYIIFSTIKNHDFRLSFGQLRKMIAAYAFMFIPLGLFITYILQRKLLLNQSIFWQGNSFFLNFGLLNRKWIIRIIIRVAQAFIFDFHWIYSSIIFLFLGLSSFKNIHMQTKGISNLFNNNKKFFGAILVICFLSFSLPILTYNTYTLPRYVLPIVPFLILFAVFALRRLVRFTPLRIGILGVILVVSIIQTFTTIDPVSKIIFGTFTFGHHQMLRMISHVNECCGYAGKDQLAYNAEFAVIDRLINTFYQKIKLSPDKAFIVGSLDVAELFIPADRVSLKRSLRLTNIVVPTVYITEDLPYLSVARRKNVLHYLYLPWNNSLSEQFARIQQYYFIGEPLSIEYNGYTVYAYPLTSKENVVLE